MIFGFLKRAGAVGVLAVLFLAHTPMRAQGPFGAPSENSAFSIPQAQLIQPEELNRLLHAGGGDKPLVLQVGSRVLFAQAHIAGAEYAGPGSQAGGCSSFKTGLRRSPAQRSLCCIAAVARGIAAPTWGPRSGCCAVWDLPASRSSTWGTTSELDGWTRGTRLSAANSRDSMEKAAAALGAACEARPRMRRLLLTSLFLGAIFAAGAPAAFAAESLVDRKAPEFVRRDLSGASLDLAASGAR